MADEQDGQEKTEEPSQYRLEEFRNKGQVAASREVSSVLILVSSILALTLSTVFIYEVISEYVHWLYGLGHAAAFEPKSLNTILIRSLSVLFKCAAPVVISSFCLGILSQVMQIGLIFAPEVLSAKFERISPIAGITRLFSSKSLFETVKGIFKIIVVIFISWILLKKDLPSFNGFLHLEDIQILLQAKYFMAKLAFSILLGLALLAIIDFAWEKYTYRQKLRLTKQEAKEETKEKEGNPEIRQRIRSIQREMSQKRINKAIKKADVIVTNPTHISVALQYDREKMLAPIVLAKGADFLALQMRELAKKHDVPIVENIQLARTIYRTVKVGEAVPRTLYKAVAEILAYVYKLRKKKKALQVDA